MMKKHEKVETVPYVDVDKYVGTWYEIGRYPHWFERGASLVTAEYIQKDGYFDVINRCVKGYKKQEKRGKAFVLPNSGNSKFIIKFGWLLKGDYWIIDLDEHYTWAVISNPRQTKLWILYRQPYISDEVLRPILYRLVNRGFNSAKIVWTEQ